MPVTGRALPGGVNALGSSGNRWLELWVDTLNASTITGLLASSIPILDAAKIGTGIFPPARLGSSATGGGLKFLADDSTYKVPPFPVTSATTPLSISTGVLSMPVANGSQNGYLSSSNWTLFNSKISPNTSATLSDLTVTNSIVAKNMPDWFTPEQFGAVPGSGVDCTAAFTQAIAAAKASSGVGGEVRLSGGTYTVDGPILMGPRKGLRIIGQGLSTVISWTGTGNLFQYAGGVQCTNNTFQSFMIASGNDENINNSAFYFPAIAERTSFLNIFTKPLEGRPPHGNIIFCDGGTDSVLVEGCQFWGVGGYGFKIGGGSEVRINNCRIIGTGRNGSSIGVYAAGGNGGVRVNHCDLIGLSVGMQTDNTNGSSNREIFIAATSFDSCDIGLYINDAPYVSIIDLWAASCNSYNVLIGNHGPNVLITGGTIFNAGIQNDATVDHTAHGLKVQSGSVILTGVTVRFNSNPSNSDGEGIVLDAGVNNSMITACRFNSNSRHINSLATNYSVSDCIFNDADNQNIIGGTGVNLFNNKYIGTSSSWFDGLNDSQVLNGTFYYSLDSSKASYKDSGGTVRALY